MPRPSNLVLTQQQETDLVQFCIDRVAALRRDNEGRIKADAASWRSYQNDADWRASDLKSVFSKSNLHLPITPMIADYFIPRAEEMLAEEEPYFGFKATGKADLDDYNRYFNWKVGNQGKAADVLFDSFTAIFVQRAHILKATHVVDKREWSENDRRILFDKTLGAPVLVPGRGPVIEGEDEWDDLPDEAEQAAPSVNPADAPAGPAEVAPPMMRKHLRADPTVIFDEAKHEYRMPPAGIRREQVLYRGPRSVQVPYDHFLCPMDAESPDAADVCGELYDQSADWLKNMWLERPWSKWASVAAGYLNGDANAQTPDEAKKESKDNLSFDKLNPKKKVIELWVRRDVLGWGTPQEFVIFIEEDGKRAVYYEFQAKVSPDFNRPYTTIAIGKVKNRWWGLSLPEKIAQYQDKIDRQFNGEAYRNEMNCNPLKGIDPTATYEEEEDLVFDPTKLYHLKTGKKMEDFVSFASLPNLDYKSQEIINFVIDLINRWLHISDVGQGDFAEGTDPTATAVNANMDESQTQARRWQRRIKRAFTDHVLKLVQIAAATMPENAEETYQFTDGDDRLTGTMTAEMIANIEIHVELVLNKKFNAQRAQSAQIALQTVQAYLSLPPEVQAVTRPLYVDLLEAQGCKNAEEKLPAPQPGMMLTPPAGGGGKPTLSPNNQGATGGAPQ